MLYWLHFFLSSLSNEGAACLPANRMLGEFSEYYRVRNNSDRWESEAQSCLPEVAIFIKKKHAYQQNTVVRTILKCRIAFPLLFYLAKGQTENTLPGQPVCCTFWKMLDPWYSKWVLQTSGILKSMLKMQNLSSQTWPAESETVFKSRYSREFWYTLKFKKYCFRYWE